MDAPLIIETPLMWINKRQTWQMANELGGEEFVELIRSETHTCYLGDRSALHDWGYGCGNAPRANFERLGTNLTLLRHGHDI